MGSQHSKSQSSAVQSKPTMVQGPSTPVNTSTITPTLESTETEYQRELSSVNLDSKKAVACKLNRFRVKVPPSMAPGDIMTIKLNGILTKVLIATPTTSSTSTGQMTCHVVDLPSRAATSCDSTSSASSPSPVEPAPSVADTQSMDSVFASNDARVPEGKMIVEAKPVIVVHAIFAPNDNVVLPLKDQMADEAVREIIQETVDSGCNAILGMTVSIKKQSEGGYLVKACGTPCRLMPAQVLLAAPPRKRTSSTELLPMRRP